MLRTRKGRGGRETCSAAHIPVGFGIWLNWPKIAMKVPNLYYFVKCWALPSRLEVHTKLYRKIVDYHDQYTLYFQLDMEYLYITDQLVAEPIVFEVSAYLYLYLIHTGLSSRTCTP